MNLSLPKARVITLPINEDDIVLRSFVLIQYWHVTDRSAARWKTLTSYSYSYSWSLCDTYG